MKPSPVLCLTTVSPLNGLYESFIIYIDSCRFLYKPVDIIFFNVLKLMLLSSQPEPSLLVCLVLNSGHRTSLAIPLPLGLCYHDSSRNSLETHVPLPILTTQGILIIYNNLNIEKIMCSLWFFFRGL